MANFKKVLAAVLSAAMVLTLAPVGATSVQAATKATAGTSTLKVSASKATLKVGAKKTIKITVNKAQAANLKVSLKSSKAAVAKVAAKTTIKKGAKTATFKIVAKKAGKANITVSYKTSANKTVKKTIKVTVKAVETNDDNVDVTDGKITIEDVDGLQTDGTARLGDTLRVNIPQNLGTMADIIWYCDEKALSTTDMGQTGVTRGANVAGKWYAIAITSKGTTYKSNVITVTATEAAAVIKDFALEDAYTAESNTTSYISYAATDNFAIATVTLNKAYPGKFMIFRKADSKFGGVVATKDSTIGNSVATFTTTNILYSADQVVAGNAGGYAFQNADGSVTYKFVVPAALTRGTEYVVAFDQTSITTDTPGRGTANVLETAVKAPYLEAPEAIEVVGASQGSNPKLAIYGAEKKALTWMGSAGSVATPVDSTKTLSQFGFSSVKFYGAAVKDTTKGTALGEDAAAGKTGLLSKGIITSSFTCGSDTFWYAEVKLNKGIYGEKDITLKTAETKDVAQPTAEKMNLTQNKTTPTSIDVTFGQLRSAGTVYILSATTAAIPVFDKDQVLTYIKSASVDKGASTVTLEGVITKTSESGGKDNYFAIFLPDDDVNYGEVRSDVAQKNVNSTVGKTDNKDNTKGYLAIEKAGAKFAYTANAKDGDKFVSATVASVFTAGGGVVTPSEVKIVDQFGEDITVANTDLNGTYVGTVSGGKAGNAILTVNGTGLAISAAAGGINPDFSSTGLSAGDTVTFTVGGSTIKFTLTVVEKEIPAGNTNATAAPVGTLVWTVSFS